MQCLYTKEDLIYLVAHQLGFLRVMESARDPMKSAIQAAIRRRITERLDGDTVKRIVTSYALPIKDIYSHARREL